VLEPWKWKILLAGKYLNVIRECGIEPPPIPGLPEEKVVDGEESEQEDMSMSSNK
jgi:gamma-tubulin complex component 2